MKAYQVYSGEYNKHGFQIYELQATYLNKDKALEHCKQIVEQTPLWGDNLEEKEWGDGKYKSWDLVGWDRVTICKLEEIEIIE